MNDRINGEGLGEAAWSGRTESNNSLNPTRLSMAFMKLGGWDVRCVVSSAVGLIRALCRRWFYCDNSQTVTALID
ncbi:MAG TPA: hypothetical protein VFQ47_02305 [Nitrososphaera sp.]|nr:hypothetical protein [Nitrososphaera sp.]